MNLLHRYDFKIIKSLFTVLVCYAFLKDKNKKKDKLICYTIQLLWLDVFYLFSNRKKYILNSFMYLS